MPVQKAAAPRLARMLKCGVQGGIGRQHLPFSSGPCSHGPPRDGARRHRHWSPTIDGAHSNVAWQLPRLSGPTRQVSPAAKRPHTHL